MQNFIADYGLWLLVGLLVLIALVFLLTRGGRDETDVAADPVADAPPAAPAPPAAAPGAMAVEPAAIAQVVPAVAPDPAIVGATPAIAPVAMPDPSPVTTPAATAVPAPASQGGDDLLKIKGIGPKLHARLIELGVTGYAQIAGWSAADIATIDAQLGSFKGRPVRDQWVDQARYLAVGDIAGYEARYGKL